MNQIQIEEFTRRRLEEEIELMTQSIESYKRNAHKGQDSVSLIADCERRIFEAAMNLGRLDLARQYVKSSEDGVMLVRLLKSMARTEDAACKCVPDVMPGNLELPLLFKWRRIFNQDTGRWTDVYKCSKCNFMTSNPRAHAAYSARNLERVRANPENRNPKKPMKDHEAFKK